jgi:hypothetical protein
MKSLRYQLLLVSLVFLGALPANAESFVTSVTLNVKQMQGGEIVTIRQTKAALLNLAAQLSGMEARTLELVYDTGTDILAVVKKSDGAVVMPQMAFSGGLSLSNNANTLRQRQAFVKFQGAASVNGSAAGKITIVRNADLSLKKFVWSGSVQINQPAGLFNPDVIINGTFLTGKRFVPTGL